MDTYLKLSLSLCVLFLGIVFAHASTASGTGGSDCKKAIAQSVSELLHTNEEELNTALETLLLKAISKLEDDDPEWCSHARKSASYALGVRFAREIVERYPKFDYTYFLLGAADNKYGTVTQTPNQLTQVLDSELLSKAERSVRFLMRFAQRADVISRRGIYYRKLPELTSNQNQCQPETSEEYEYTIRFLQVDPIDQLDMKEVKVEIQADDCHRFFEHELIRGWRTALQLMNEGEVWDVVIPARLAYGSAGAGETVVPDEALRFVIKLVRKQRQLSYLHWLNGKDSPSADVGTTVPSASR